MKILIISPFNIFPPYSGANVRILNIVKNLSINNQIFFAFNSYSQVRGKNIIGNYNNVKFFSIGPPVKFTQLFNPLLFTQIITILRKEKIDTIIGEYLWSGIYLLLLKKFYHKRYFFDNHNIEYKLINFNYGIIGKMVSPFIKIYEKIIIKNSLITFCVSDEDKNELNKLNKCKNKPVVIPNGVDTSIYTKNSQALARKKLGIHKNERITLFFGKLDYQPNHEAVKIIYKQILPRVTRTDNRIKFLVAGHGSFNYKHRNIIFVGVVDDIRAYINAANLVIIPLINGSGTRIKILESISCHKIVISTSVGAHGLINEYTHNNLIIKDDWDDFSDAIVKYINEGEKKPPEKFYNYYDWVNITKRMDRIINQHSLIF